MRTDPSFPRRAPPRERFADVEFRMRMQRLDREAAQAAAKSPSPRPSASSTTPTHPLMARISGQALPSVLHFALFGDLP
jgi:hypothetical protein